MSTNLPVGTASDHALDASATVLIGADDESCRYLLEHLLTSQLREMLNISQVSQPDYLLLHLLHHPTDLLLIDSSILSEQAVETVHEISQALPGLPIIVLASARAATPSIELIRAGAQDCLVKEHVNSAVLERVITFTLESQKNIPKKLNQHAIFWQAFQQSSDPGFIVKYLPERGFFYEESNVAYCNALGRQPADLIGRSLHDVLPQQWAKSLIKHLQTCVHQNQQLRFYKTLSWLERSPTWEILLVPVQAHSSNITWIQVSARDVTEQQQAAANLQEREAYFRAIADATPALIWVADASLQRTFMNQHWYSFTGQPLERLINHGWRDFIHPDDVGQYCKAVEAACSNRQSFRLEYRLQRANGNYSWVLDVANPQFTELGALNGYVGSCTDISAAKQLESSLQAQIRQERLIKQLAQQTSKATLRDVLNIVVAEARDFLQADRMLVFQLRHDLSGQVMVESTGTHWQSLQGTTIHDPCFAQDYLHLYRYGRTKATTDVHNAGLGECYLNMLEQFQVRSNLVVPIRHETKLWGLLIAHQCAATRNWQYHEIHFLQQLAEQLGVSMQQAEVQQHQVELVLGLMQ